MNSIFWKAKRGTGADKTQDVGGMRMTIIINAAFEYMNNGLFLY